MKYLTLKERKLIEKMYNKENKSFRSIGKVLGRQHSTISAEVKNNLYNFEYNPLKGHNKYLFRQLNKGNTKKLDTNILLRNHVIYALQDQLSPDQIVGELKASHLSKKIGCVCHETIYAYIYDTRNKHLQLWKHLRRHRPKRKSYSSRLHRNKGSTLKHRTSIHDRPSVVNNKKRFGDWEVDLMIFSKQKQVLSVHVERLTKLTRIYICDNKTKEQMYDTLQATISDLPAHSVKTITFDNGTENALHYKLTQDYDVDTFFCDPYCSWQKGLVENTNMLLRQYLPRNINLDSITPDQLYSIQEKLNNRPRKSLNYITPNNAFLIHS